MLGSNNCILSHIDLASDERLISQNFKGIKNDSLQTRELIYEREEEIMSFIKGIVDRISEEKGEYTSVHIRSVCSIAENIARKMDLSNEEIELIKIGALLHDVGKLDVDKNIIQKPAKLTDEEFFEMRSHVSFGEIELNQIDLGNYERAKNIAAEHHERYDGRGYPRGLKGEDIDILSRVVSIADSTQAMFGRSYQSGRTKDDLIRELQKCAGTQFDPQMADILCEILDKEPESIGVTYDEQGKISYQVQDTETLLSKKPTFQEKSSFLDSLKSGVNNNAEYRESPKKDSNEISMDEI